MSSSAAGAAAAGAEGQQGGGGAAEHHEGASVPYSSQQQQQDEQPSRCKVCHRGEIEYECMPCSHPTLCKACAMKQATGGKCKTCGELFSELRRQRHSLEQHHDDDDDQADT